MGIKELSQKLAAISFVADEAKKAKDELRAQLLAEMDAIGADRVKAELDGETIAFVLQSKPKFKWIVQSEREFTEWVKVNHPSEVVESVRESSREKILEGFTYTDDFVIDPNGEPVNWLMGSETDPYLMTKFASEGREKLRNAILSNSIDARKLLELE